MPAYKDTFFKSLILFTCLLFLSASPLFSQANQSPEPENKNPFPILKQTEGVVRIIEEGSFLPKTAEKLPHILKSGDKVQTFKNSKALIRAEDDLITLDEDSTFLVLSIDEGKLENGKALFEIRSRDGKKLKAQTPLIVIGVKGTTFLLSSNEKREDIAMLEGEVEIKRHDKQAIAHFQVKAKEELSFEDYVKSQKKIFKDYKEAFMQDFNEYKKSIKTEFIDFKGEIELKSGKKLVLSADKTPEAIEDEIDEANRETIKILKEFKDFKDKKSSLK